MQGSHAALAPRRCVRRGQFASPRAHTTVHANDTRDALQRLELMIALSGAELPTRVARQYIASAIQIFLHVARLANGERKVIRISELTGVTNGEFDIEDIFVYRMAGVDGAGRMLGSFYATG